MSVRILAGIPTLRNTDPDLDRALAAQDLPADVTLDKAVVSFSPLPSARQTLLKMAVSGGFDYFWSLDDDVVPHKDCLKKLIEADKQIVGGVYLLKVRIPFADGTIRHVPSFGGYSGRIREDPDTGAQAPELTRAADWPTEGIQEVAWLCLGSCLIRKDVFATLGAGSFRDFANTGDDSIAFSRNCQRLGIPLHIRYDALVGHIHKRLVQPQLPIITGLRWSEQELREDGSAKVITEPGAVPNGCELILRRSPA